MKKILTLILTAILGVACCLGLTACGNTGTLKIGYTIYKPMNYYDEENNFVGFDTELAKEVGKILNKNIEFVEINWDNKVTDLETGAIDVVWNGMTITEELQQAMEITSPYRTNKQVVVCKTADAANYVTTSDILNASEILVEAGSAGQDAVEAVAGVDTNKVITAAAQKDTLLSVKTGSNKIAVIDMVMAQSVTGEGTDYSDLTFIDVNFEIENFGIGCKKGNVELKNNIESAIQTLKDNGRYQELVTKYFE